MIARCRRREMLLTCDFAHARTSLASPRHGQLGRQPWRRGQSGRSKSPCHLAVGVGPFGKAAVGLGGGLCGCLSGLDGGERGFGRAFASQLTAASHGRRCLCSAMAKTMAKAMAQAQGYTQKVACMLNAHRRSTVEGHTASHCYAWHGRAA